MSSSEVFSFPREVVLSRGEDAHQGLPGNSAIQDFSQRKTRKSTGGLCSVASNRHKLLIIGSLLVAVTAAAAAGAAVVVVVVIIIIIIIIIVLIRIQVLIIIIPI